MKNIKIVAYIIILAGTFALINWIQVLVYPEALSAYIETMNYTGMVFTPLAFKIHAMGIIGFISIGIISGILLLKFKDAGRKLLIAACASFPVYCLIWLIVNFTLGRKMHLFIINIVVGLIILFSAVKYLNRPEIKDYLK